MIVKYNVASSLLVFNKNFILVIKKRKRWKITPTNITPIRILSTLIFDWKMSSYVKQCRLRSVQCIDPSVVLKPAYFFIFINIQQKVTNHGEFLLRWGLIKQRWCRFPHSYNVFKLLRQFFKKHIYILLFGNNQVFCRLDIIHRKKKKGAAGNSFGTWSFWKNFSWKPDI